MSSKFTTRKHKFLNKKIDLNKKMLFTNFWMPTICLILGILVANAFLPLIKPILGAGESPKGIWADGKLNADLPIGFKSTMLALDNVNMIAYIVLVSIIALTGIFLVSLRLFRARESIKVAFTTKNMSHMLVFFSSVISIISCIAFLVLIIVMPLLTADMREHITVLSTIPLDGHGVIGSDGKAAIRIKLGDTFNPAINTTVYYLMLIPVFIAIAPMTYIAGLALFFEIQKRKNKIDYFAK